VPDPYVSDLPERPDPEVLLIDAVISRQDDLAARLAQQWVHRRGWSDLDAFIDAGLLRTCGPEGVAWLRQQMRHNPRDRPAAEPRPSLGTLFQQAFDEALAPIRPDSHDDATPSSDPWGLAPQLQQPARQPVLAKVPAPCPADLAELRSWLHSDAA
jgi:hypothetical protein